MTEIKLTPALFENVLVPALGLNSAIDDAELCVAARIVRKIRVISTPESLDDKQKNGFLLPTLKLNSGTEVLLLDDVEAAYVERLLRKHVVRVNLLVADHYHDLLMQLSRTSQEE